MATLKELAKYTHYTFSSGCDTGEDYKSFQRKYINYLKSIANEYGWELVKTIKGHYEFSAFFKFKDRFAYMSISDVRFFKNEWFSNILIRTAKNEKDYTGGQNNYTNIGNLKYAIYSLFNRGY